MPDIIGEAAYRVTADTSGFQRQAESGVGRAMGRLGGVIKTGAKAGAVGIAALGASVAVAGIKFDSMRQQAQIAFTTMLGSGEKAKKFLDELQSFAAKTPFEFPDLTRASQRLLAMGFQAKDIIPTMTAVGDAVAGLGGGAEQIDIVTRALGQMQAKGTASAEEMLQLTEAGIPAWQFLADTLNVDVAQAMDMVTKKQVDAGTAIDAVVGGMNKKFGGMMEAQSHTLAGLWSTFKDTFAIISGQIMGPFFDFATSGLEGINKVLGKVLKAPTVSAKLSIVWEGIQEAAGDLWDNFLTFWNGEQAGRKPIMVDGKNVAFEGTPATEGFRQKLIDAFESVNWNDVGQRIADGMGTAVMTAITSISWGDVARVGFELFRAGWELQMKLIPQMFVGIGPGLIALFQQIDWGAAWEGLNRAFEENLPTDEEIGSKLSELAVGAAAAAGRFVAAIVVTVATLPGRVIIFVQNMIANVLGRLAGFVGSAAGQARGVVSGIVNSFTSLAGRVGGFVASMVSGALGKLQGLVGSAGSAAGRVVTGIANAFTGIAGKVIGKIGDLGLPGKLSGIASSALGWAAGIGRSITDGVKNGLGDLKGAVEDWVSDAVSDLNPFSPVEHGGAKYIGEPLMQGAIAGIESLTPALNAAIRSATPGAATASGTVDGGTTTNNRTINVGQVVLPTVTNGGDLVRQLDALVARPG